MGVGGIIWDEAHRATRKAWASNVARVARAISMGILTSQLRKLSWRAREIQILNSRLPVWSA